VLSVGGKLGWIFRVEFNPVLILELNRILELEGHNWTFFLLISPVPKRDSLWLVITQGDQVLVVHRQIKAFDTIGVRIQKSSYWSS
jgi:hypothetical protein